MCSWPRVSIPKLLLVVDSWPSASAGEPQLVGIIPCPRGKRRPPNHHDQFGEPPEPHYECGDRGWGEKRQTPKNPPPLQTGPPKPHAPEPLSPLIGEGTTYAPYIGARHPGLANPAPSARDVWLMRVGGPGPGARRKLWGRDNPRGKGCRGEAAGKKLLGGRCREEAAGRTPKTPSTKGPVWRCPSCRPNKPPCCNFSTIFEVDVSLVRQATPANFM